MCGDWYVTAPAAAPKVQIVTITTCSSAGEALRAIDQKNLIKSDFVLVHPRLVPMGSTGGQDPAPCPSLLPSPTVRVQLGVQITGR